jgi:hypothetical protein
MRLRFASMLGITTILAASLFVAGCAKKSTDNSANNTGGSTATNQPAAGQNSTDQTATSQPPQAGDSSGGVANSGSAPAAVTPAPPLPPATIDVTLPAGTKLSVLIDETVSSKTNSAGDSFAASLARPVILDGRTIFPKHSAVTGRVTNAVPSGRLKTPAELAVKLVAIRADGNTYNISTKTIASKGDSHKNRNLGFIGGGGAGGALIGGLAGGGKGALIGGLIGAGAGTAGAAATGKKDISIAAETRMLFVTSAPVTVTVANTPPAPAETGAGAQGSNQD